MRASSFASACVLSAAVSFAVVAAADTAPAATPAPEVRIPFANHDGIYDWHVVDDHTILIQGQNRKWYKATLFAPCTDLPFSQGLGFATNPDGSFDKFSSIRVRGQTCSLASLVETTAPAKKAKAAKADAAPSSPAK